jgi:hypothetical protein
MEPSIFIVGTQRSGTTLLCSMLTAHPHIFMQNEMPNSQTIFSCQRPKREVLNDIYSEMYNMYKENFEDFLKRIGKRRWGLKDPSLTYCLHGLVESFPDAKILFIIRDGRAVANSYIKSKWGSATNTYHGAIRWKREMELQRAFIQIHKENSFIVKYEDLVTNPEEELRKISSFLEEDYSENMRNYFVQSTYITKNELNKHVFHDVDKALLSKWRDELTPYQIGVFESVAGDMLLQNQYSLCGKQVKISELKKAWFTVQQKIVGTVQLYYQLKSPAFQKFFHNILRKENSLSQ